AIRDRFRNGRTGWVGTTTGGFETAGWRDVDAGRARKSRQQDRPAAREGRPRRLCNRRRRLQARGSRAWPRFRFVNRGPVRRGRSCFVGRSATADEAKPVKV